MHKMVVPYNSNVCENSLVQWNASIHRLPRENVITMSPVLVGRNFSSVDILLTFTLCQCNVMTLLNNLSGTGAWSVRNTTIGMSILEPKLIKQQYMYMYLYIYIYIYVHVYNLYNPTRLLIYKNKSYIQYVISMLKHKVLSYIYCFKVLIIYSDSVKWDIVTAPLYHSSWEAEDRRQYGECRHKQ